MKTLATFVQITALGACFATHVLAAGDIHLTGMRRAMQIAEGILVRQIPPALPGSLATGG